MARYKVERGIKAPEIKNAGRKLRYPLDEMDVGDSFSFHEKDIQSVRSAGYAYARAHGMKFSIRKTQEGEPRCWRIK